MTLGQKIKERRKQLGISADTLAEVLGVSRSTIFRYENGDIEKLPVDSLTPLASALHTTPLELLGYSVDADAPAPPTETNPDTELEEYLEELRTRPEMKMLFSLTKDATKEDVEASVRIIEAYLNKGGADE